MSSPSQRFLSMPSGSLTVVVGDGRIALSADSAMARVSARARCMSEGRTRKVRDRG